MLKKLITIPQNSPETFGIILRIGSGIFFAIMVGLIKLLGDKLALSQLIFFRSLFAIIPLVIFLQFTSNFPKGLVLFVCLTKIFTASRGNRYFLLIACGFGGAIGIYFKRNR